MRVYSVGPRDAVAGSSTLRDDNEYLDDGTMLDYPHPTVAMEFEFNMDEKLTYWHLFEPTHPR